MLRKLIAPESIAIVGASEDTNKPGGRIIRNLLLKGYQGPTLSGQSQGLTHPRPPRLFILEGSTAKTGSGLLSPFPAS